MEIKTYYKLKDGVQHEVEEGAVTIVFESHGVARSLKLEGLTSGLIAATEGMAANKISEDELFAKASGSGGFGGELRFMEMLKTFKRIGLLTQYIESEIEELLQLHPMCADFNANEPLQELDLEQPVILSRFAYIHRIGNQIVAESPMCNNKLISTNSMIPMLLGMLCSPCTLSQLQLAATGLGEKAIRYLVMTLHENRFISNQPQQSEEIEEESGSRLLMWDFHDLLFHARSRFGRHDNPYGGTFRFLGKIPPQPAIRSSVSNNIIKLHKPDIAFLKENDIPFSRVLEQRCSIREYDDEPLTAEQLGEFLYRTVRVKKLLELSPKHVDTGEVLQYTKRIFPSGGASYELELYLSITKCRNIESGFYHYCPKEHQLERISDINEKVKPLLFMAKAALKSEPDAPLPQILFTYAARFQRVTWKYASISYSIILKDVGVLQQTMNLVAEAMDIGSCALGGGNPDAFVKAAGCNYYEESSVGEFVIGRKKQNAKANEDEVNPHGEVKVLYQEKI